LFEEVNNLFGGCSQVKTGRKSKNIAATNNGPDVLDEAALRAFMQVDPAKVQQKEAEHKDRSTKKKADHQK